MKSHIFYLFILLLTFGCKEGGKKEKLDIDKKDSLSFISDGSVKHNNPKLNNLHNFLFFKKGITVSEVQDSLDFHNIKYTFYESKDVLRNSNSHFLLKLPCDKVSLLNLPELIVNDIKLTDVFILFFENKIDEISCYSDGISQSFYNLKDLYVDKYINASYYKISENLGNSEDWEFENPIEHLKAKFIFQKSYTDNNIKFSSYSYFFFNFYSNGNEELLKCKSETEERLNQLKNKEKRELQKNI